MSDSRTSNSLKNIFTSIGYQALNLVLSFISRTIFIKTLGVEYLGISGLFGDILSMLTLADLGFSTAMTYSMYKPLAEGDWKTLAGLTNLYKKVYRMIAVIVTGVGLTLIPFLPYLVNLEKPMPHLTLYYLLFLANTVASYLVVYKTNILAADQKNYILTKYTAIFNFVQTIALMIVLVTTKNYIIYLITQVGFVYFANFYKSHISQKMYPLIREKETLPKEQQRSIFKNIGSVFLYKVSSVLINATDNTLISVLVGTEWVGYYSNYSIIITRLTGLVNTFFYSLTASLGNLIVKERQEKRYEIFRIMQSLSSVMATVCVTCVFLLQEDFIRIWLGKDFVLGNFVLAAVVLNFYFSIILLPIWVFREATGLYTKTKLVMLATAGINIIVSIIWGRLMGLAGILFATSFSRLITYFWYEPKILFKNYFGKSCRIYFAEIIRNLLYTVLFVAVLRIVTYRIIPETWGNLVVKACLVFILIVLLCAGVYRKSEGIILLGDKIKVMFNSKAHRKG